MEILLTNVFLVLFVRHFRSHVEIGSLLRSSQSCLDLSGVYIIVNFYTQVNPANHTNLRFSPV